jgi:hypothetical protein
MILLKRFLPFTVGLFEAVIFFEQRNHPTMYPWIILLGILILPLAAVTISWKRIEFSDVIEKMTPTFLLMTSLAFALVLAEGDVQFGLILGIASVAAFLSLEVLFLMAYYPAAYPVNGISRVNIGYVPFIIWYAVSTSSGLMTFIQINRFWHLALCIVLGVLLFRTTGHPGATRRQNTIWIFVGFCVGVEVGFLGMLLPLSMAMQGLVAAMIFSGALRVRRYLYEPKPSIRLGWNEAVAIILFCGISLSTAKWF